MSFSALGSLAVLPEEVLLHILYFIGGSQVLKVVARLSKAFNRLANDEPVLWRGLCVTYSLSAEHRHPDHARPWQWLWRAKRVQLTTVEGVTGPACFTWPDTGIRYEGEWKDGKRHGYGVSTQASRFQYVGYWENDKKHGRGRQTWEDGSSYDGMWEAGQKQGYGVYSWQDGERYEGEWRADEEHGRGVYRWSSGDVYNGEWESGAKHGYGVHVWGEGPWKGDRYEGQWRSDTQNGEGTYRWNDGRVYQGGWLAHKRHGFGRYTFPDGAYYEGAWLEGFREGQGTQRWASGACYTGPWSRDVPTDYADKEEWDGFFLRSKEEQRTYVRELLRNLQKRACPYA